MKLCIVIATYNRADDLIECIKSINLQTVEPEKIIIVDSTTYSDKNIEERIREVSSLNIQYINTKQKGLTLQRNLALKLIPKDAELVMFLDDDILLDNDYVENVSKFFEEDTNEEIGGVEGYLTRDGDKEYPKVPKDNKKVQLKSLYGCNMTYRVNKIVGMTFDENLQLYSFMEDWDFSYRVGLKTKLYKIHSAQAVHNQSKAGRIDYVKNGFMRIANKYYLKKKNNAITLFDYFIFVLTIIRNCLCSFNKDRRARFKGNIIAVRRVIIKKENINIVLNI